MEYICNQDPQKLKVDCYNRSKGTLTDYDCPLCNNRGDFLKTEDNRLFFTPCKCMKIRNNLKRIEKSGLENMIKRYRYDNFRKDKPWQETIYNTASDYCKNPEGWFYIGGQPGCGKTHICTAIANNLMEKGRDTIYMLWREECIKLKSVICDSIDYNRIISPLKKVSVLYIDDFLKSPGAGNPSSADLGIAYEILNYRYVNKLCTLISSEYSLEAIYSIDDAIAGRIEEMARKHLLVIDLDMNKNQRKTTKEN